MMPKIAYTTFITMIHIEEKAGLRGAWRALGAQKRGWGEAGALVEVRGREGQRGRRARSACNAGAG